MKSQLDNDLILSIHLADVMCWQVDAKKYVSVLLTYFKQFTNALVCMNEPMRFAGRTNPQHFVIVGGLLFRT